MLKNDEFEVIILNNLFRFYDNSSSHTDKFIFNLECGQSLMIENFRCLSSIESEMEHPGVSESNNTYENHDIW